MSMSSPPLDTQCELPSPSKQSFTAQSTVAEPPASLPPVTRSRLSRIMQRTANTSEDLLEVREGGRRPVDEYLLLGVRGAAHSRDTTPTDCRKRQEDMRNELEDLHEQAKRERRERSLRSRAAGAGSLAKASTSTSPSTKGSTSKRGKPAAGSDTDMHDGSSNP